MFRILIAINRGEFLRMLILDLIDRNSARPTFSIIIISGTGKIKIFKNGRIV